MRLVATSALSVVFLVAPCLAGQKSPIETEADRISYSLGHQIGMDLKRQKAELDPMALRRGLTDGLAGAEPSLPREEMAGVLEGLKGKILTAQRKGKEKLAERRLNEGRAFLAENGKKEGVVTLPSGLQYKILREGKGRSPGPTDRVAVRYRGTTVGGTEFHNSFSHENPENHAIEQVIPGLKEGIQLMKSGARWEFYLPSNLAYGDRGPLADQAVIFDVELLAVVAEQK